MLTGADKSQYVIASNNCSGQVVAPGGSCAVAVKFKPSSTGAHDAASLVVSSDDPGSPDTFALQGSGVAPKLKVKPKRARFGPIAVRGGKKVKSVKITNTGTAPLKVSAITLAGPKGNFKAKSKACVTTVATGATCTFKVTFNPKVAGKLSGKITITTDGGVATVKLQGVGLA